MKTSELKHGTNIETSKCGNKESFFNHLNNETVPPISEQLIEKCNKQYLNDLVMKNGMWSSFRYSTHYGERYFLSDSEYWKENPFSSNLFLFLVTKFESKYVRRAILKYKVTSPSFDSSLNIFWQIDSSKNVVDGRILKFDKVSGKNLSDTDKTKAVLISEIFEQTIGCYSYHKKTLFGLHRLTKSNTLPICIVEDEMTAIMASIIFPNSLWLATSGQTLDYSLFSPVFGQNVTLFPNNENFEEWKIQANNFEFNLSTMLKNNYHQASGDLADFFLSKLNELGR